MVNLVFLCSCVLAFGYDYLHEIKNYNKCPEILDDDNFSTKKERDSLKKDTDVFHEGEKIRMIIDGLYIYYIILIILY